MTRIDEEPTAAKIIGGLALRVTITALAVLVIYVAAKYAYDFGKDIFYQMPAESAPGRDIEVELSEDSDLAAVLSENGLVRNEKAFAIMTKFYKTDPAAGVYVLNTSLTTKELLTKIAARSEEIEAEQEAADAAGPENVVGGGDEEG